MGHRRVLIATTVVAIVVAACSSAAATPSPTAAPPSQAPASQGAASEAPSASAAPIASIGPGEGELDIVVWPGYAEDGSNVKEYDWVHPFEQKNPDCGKVNVKPADTSDDMYTLMSQGHGVYDGVSASGDASNRLIDRAEVAPVDPAVIPNYADLSPFLQSPANNTVNGVPLRDLARLGRQHPDVPDGQVRDRTDELERGVRPVPDGQPTRARSRPMPGRSTSPTRRST